MPFSILTMGDRLATLIYVVGKGLPQYIYANVNNRCIYEKIFGFIFLGFYCYFIFHNTIARLDQLLIVLHFFLVIKRATRPLCSERMFLDKEIVQFLKLIMIYMCTKQRLKITRIWNMLKLIRHRLGPVINI